MIPCQLQALVPQDLRQAIWLSWIKSIGVISFGVELHSFCKLLWSYRGQEEIGELVLRHVHLSNQSHAKVLGVKLDCCWTIFDPHHCLREVVVLWPSELLTPHNL